jgi:4-amino-4-deoxy-L-arabinose transferase-like glycosyltransferase
MFFIALNLFTIEWFPLPWVDEISLHDDSINFVLNGEWRTTACFGDRNNEVYSTYPPLYQFILVPWIYIFGVSPLSCRSLNIMLLFLICVIIYRFLRNSNVIKDYYSLAIFLLLFWCAGIFSWIYRNGRPDVLNMLCVICFLTCYYEKRNKLLLALFAFLIVTSGIQACPYLMGILVCLYFFQSEKKRIKTTIYMFIAGTIAGLIFLNIYFYLQGHLLSFYYRSFILASTTVKDAISFLMPYVEHTIPVDESIKNALLKPDHSVSTSFFEKIMNAYLVNKEYLILCLANVIVYLGLLFKRKIVCKSTESKLISITLIIPLIMTIAGRFAVYYTWMCYIPSVLYLIYIIGKHNRQIYITLVYGLATFAIVSSGLPKTLITVDKKAYKKIESFVLKQNFSNKDKIISPFISYYAVRNITKDCYCTGLYPLSLVPEDTKYILTAKDDYGSENMNVYIKYCESAGKKVSVIDSLDSPRMILYIVE